MKPVNPTVVLYNSFTASILLKSPLESFLESSINTLRTTHCGQYTRDYP